MPVWLALIDPISKLLDRIIPDPAARDKAKLELAKEENAQALQEIQTAAQLDQAQIAVNQAEAQNQALFASGWRPFMGWVCGVAFAYHFIAQPLLAFILVSIGHPVMLPSFDMQTLSAVLMGMLGLGSLRTIEKVYNNTPK